MPDTAAVSALDNCLVTGRSGAPMLVVLGGISAGRNVREWWPAVVGDGLPVDTREFRVLGVDFLDGGERADGRPSRVVTTHDQADRLAAALDQLGVERLHAFIGASYGGMVALAFAERHAGRVDRLVAVSAPAAPHPMSTAMRSLQRRIVELGLDTGRARDALAIARGLAMTTYRSAEEFGTRFADFRPPPSASREDVEGYLRYHGEKFAAWMAPARFLGLSLSSDLHRVDPGACTTPALFVAAPRDTLVPLEQMQALDHDWAGPSRLVETQTHTGHDAFLAEPAQVGRFIHEALTGRVAS